MLKIAQRFIDFQLICYTLHEKCLCLFGNSVSIDENDVITSLQFKLINFQINLFYSHKLQKIKHNSILE